MAASARLLWAVAGVGASATGSALLAELRRGLWTLRRSAKETWRVLFGKEHHGIRQRGALRALLQPLLRHQCRRGASEGSSINNTIRQDGSRRLSAIKVTFASVDGRGQPLVPVAAYRGARPGGAADAPGDRLS